MWIFYKDVENETCGIRSTEDKEPFEFGSYANENGLPECIICGDVFEDEDKLVETLPPNDVKTRCVVEGCDCIGTYALVHMSCLN